jgi:DNA-directed RNA polymerase subunit RPC12/RpoP
LKNEIMNTTATLSALDAHSSGRRRPHLEWIRCFILSAGFILLAAALTRFVIAAGNAQVLSLPDPMLGIPLRYAVLVVGAFELGVALICLFGRRVGLQIGWLAWLGTNYVVLWIGLFSMRINPQATCVGSLTDPLHLSRGLTGLIVQLLPFGLALGSYAALLQLWLAKRVKAERPSAQTAVANSGTARTGATVLVRTLKISCTACGGHVEFPTNLLGEKIPCPHCRATIILKRADNIKMSCSSCGGNIEFPSHALGEKIPCPHCNTEFILVKPA